MRIRRRWKVGRKAPRSPPRKRREGRLCKKAGVGGWVVGGVCEGYPEGTNCSGVRCECCQHTSCQHTPGARHTYTHMHTGLALSIRTNPANCSSPTITIDSPSTPETPEEPIWNQSAATAPVPNLPCCRPGSCIFHRVTDTGCLRSCHKKCIAHDNAWRMEDVLKL